MIRQLDDLLQRQARAWPQFAKGLEGLARAITRRERIDWFEVFVRHIPHRAASTTAPVDRESVARRPCFLCPANLPAEEEGLPFDEDFTIYCNPFPIVERHLTITHREHRPQRIENRLGTMLDLAAALPGYFVIYNGPECGASAPDHLHFQAGARTVFPIERETAAIAGLTVPNYGRSLLRFRGPDRSAMIDAMDRAIELLAAATAKKPEPMLNLAVFHERGEWTACLFPRAKHRPEVFHTGELTVSPASIDLCGIFVVPLARDFERITGAAIAAIFREVTLPDAVLREVAAGLESGR
jgi:ATP adenylyltransferase/5',5'''-P-1,P-4-tetraphosphate phosphorylase II